MGGDIGELLQTIMPRALKSTPPAWAGTVPSVLMDGWEYGLNPPRPHGRGQRVTFEVPMSFTA